VKRNAKAVEPYTGPVFAVGETVKINRPSPLWAGCVGDVVKIENGIHRVRIAANPDGSTCTFFHADIIGHHLESWI
jgi:hypothetical protein